MNTGGNNCEICAPNYYSMSKDPNLVCAKCECDLEGVLDLKEPCDRVKRLSCHFTCLVSFLCKCFFFFLFQNKEYRKMFMQA
jgi:hypothetical protein